jgi:hypothetical protein
MLRGDGDEPAEDRQRQPMRSACANAASGTRQGAIQRLLFCNSGRTRSPASPGATARFHELTIPTVSLPSAETIKMPHLRLLIHGELPTSIGSKPLCRSDTRWCCFAPLVKGVSMTDWVRSRSSGTPRKKMHVHLAAHVSTRRVIQEHFERFLSVCFVACQWHAIGKETTAPAPHETSEDDWCGFQNRERRSRDRGAP